MEIKNYACAGNVVKNDALIEIWPKDTVGVEIELVSIVKIQFGYLIEQACRDMCMEMGVSAAKIRIEDKGALDYVIKARTEAAIMRAQRGEDS